MVYMVAKLRVSQMANLFSCQLQDTVKEARSLQTRKATISHAHFTRAAQAMRGVWASIRTMPTRELELATASPVGACAPCASQNELPLLRWNPSRCSAKVQRGRDIGRRPRPQQRLEATTGVASTALLIWPDGLLGIAPQPPSIVKKAVGQYQEGRRA